MFGVVVSFLPPPTPALFVAMPLRLSPTPAPLPQMPDDWHRYWSRALAAAVEVAGLAPFGETDDLSWKDWRGKWRVAVVSVFTKICAFFLFTC